MDATANPATRSPIGLGAVRLPVAIVAGLALMAGAFVLDLAAHAGAVHSIEPGAHLAGVLGMVLTWAAVVVDGLTQTARRA